MVKYTEKASTTYHPRPSLLATSDELERRSHTHYSTERQTLRRARKEIRTKLLFGNKAERARGREQTRRYSTLREDVQTWSSSESSPRFLAHYQSSRYEHTDAVCGNSLDVISLPATARINLHRCNGARSNTRQPSSSNLNVLWYCASTDANPTDQPSFVVDGESNEH
jgi:hypothetical protein